MPLKGTASITFILLECPDTCVVRVPLQSQHQNLAHATAYGGFEYPP